jgi:amidase
MKEIVLRPAVEQLNLLQAGEVSVLELAEAHIGQIERVNRQVNAFADFDPSRVRVQARAMDSRRNHLKPLHGLPVTVKSSLATAGYRCEIGSRICKGEIPSQDAVAVARLRAAGALILGTTNCPEFLMAYETDNQLCGQTANPWDLSRTPGGSSGGESAAIAAGMSAAGLGSDSGGSVRVPAHFTGICALKPTPGRIPSAGHLPPCVGPFSTLGAIGPMARTVEDLALLFGVLAGQNPDEPGSPPIAPRKPVLADLRAHPIGFFEDDGLVPVTGETRAAVQAAAAVLRAAGFRVEPFRPRTLEPLRKLWRRFFVQCGVMFCEAQISGKEDLLSPIFRDFLAMAAKVPAFSASELLDSWAHLDILRAEMLAEMRTHPVLLCPVASVPAFRHGERIWEIEGRAVEYLDAWRFAQWFNVLSAPAAVVPVGRSPEGLPIGVQIVARPFEDETVLAVAGIVDKAFGFRAPPLALAG